MPAPNPLPKYVYKIVPTVPPQPIPKEYPLSELDQADGFVHLSIASQIPVTAGRYFQGQNELWVIKITYQGGRLGDSTDTTTNWDTPGCPHLYGNFGINEIAGVRQFSKADGERWEDKIGAEVGQWLE